MNSFAQETISSIGKFILFEKVKKPFLRPSYDMQLEDSFHFDRYISYIEQLVKKILPQDILEELIHGCDEATIAKILSHFRAKFPFFKWSLVEKTGGTLCTNLLTSARFSSGIGRYILDTMSRLLIPGKIFPIVSVQTLNFQFVASGEHQFYFQQMMIPIENKEDIPQIRQNLALLERIITLTIRAVAYARKIMSIQSFSMKEKKEKIEENIFVLSELSSIDFNQNIFEHIHQLFIKLYAEDKTNKFKETFASILKNRPQALDRAIFTPIQNLILLYPEKFIAQRELSHISRLITTQYLFKKSFEQEEGVRVKLFKTQLQTSQRSRQVLGILVGISFQKDMQVCDERHILTAVCNYISKARLVKDSLIIDQATGGKQIRFLYLEIEKENEDIFSSAEFRSLRLYLPHELQEIVQNIYHPTFMPRNEEEVMRNIVILSQQLKYVNDPPQAIISFDRQTHDTLSFNIIFLRIRKPKDQLIETILKESKFLSLNVETKKVGMLRKKHPKEAHVFTFLLDKKAFLRKDFSLDLFRARRMINLELHRLFGEIRDFNGGILARQHEIFHSVCQEIAPKDPNCEFFLENFFYSLSPSLMQSLLSASVLKKLFTLFLEAIETNFKKTPLLFSKEEMPECLLIMIAAANPQLKSQVFSLINPMNIPSSKLTFAFVELQGISYLGLLYLSPFPAEQIHFYKHLSKKLM